MLGCSHYRNVSKQTTRAVVRLSDPKLKFLGERGIKCIFVGYAEHSKAFRFYVIEHNDSILINSIIESRDAIFDENRFSSVPRPSLRIPNGTEDIGGLVVPDEVTKDVVQQPELRKSKRNRTPKDFGPDQLYVIEGTRDGVSDQHSYCFNVEDDPKTFDEAMKSQDVALWKVAINDEMDSIIDNNTLGLNMKVIRIAISQSHYIENVLKKFNHFDCTPVSTPMDTSEKLMPNNGLYLNLSILRYTSNTGTQHWQAIQRVTLMQAGSANSEDNSSTSGWVFLLGGGKEAEWLKNLLFEIPLWSKPIAPIFIRCDCAATLAKAYSQMYNGKSRHLGVKHSMIRELITNGVISIEFVRSQQNLADHLTKGLVRDLIIKFAEGMRLKSN
uniref:Zinc finger, CCHC-type n=1 Tax=Tanacetum cinerariifolium TaxID=118510 RepID=A0A6L2MR86_TANCI|nr:zinc finger, CCHC-type [Tanacetum cinerariifolium]